MATNESGPLLVARVTARGRDRGTMVNNLHAARRDMDRPVEPTENQCAFNSNGGDGGPPAWEYSITEGEAEAASLRGQVDQPNIRALFEAYEKASIEATNYERRFEEAAEREAFARAALLASLEGR